jgi:hypothetical protein
VLDTGKVVPVDTAAVLLANEQMKAHYLGVHVHVKEARQHRQAEPVAASG